MATNTTKPVHSLILDSGPIIKNEPSVSTLLSQAEEVYTIPAVIDEIRDATTRARIETTLKPFLRIKSPRQVSVKVITDFARKTGDLEVLSKTDIQVLALAYELEVERNKGDWRLRSTPGQARLNGKPPGSELGEKEGEGVKNSDSVTEDTSTITASGDLEEKIEKVPAVSNSPSEEPQQATEILLATANFASILPTSETTGIEEQLASTQISPAESELNSETPPTIVDTPPMDITAEEPTPVEPEEVQDAESEDSDGEGWITPQNLKDHQEKDANGSAEPGEEVSTMQVALITTDFAMQNVLLQMNLNLLTPSLQRIRQLKTWALRCHACFLVTKDMAKQFCRRCGKPTLSRVSCSTDKNGKFQVHLKKNMQWNTRGNVYSIPKPVAGSSNGKLVSGGGKGGWGQSLILAEDQKEYVQAMTVVRRNKERDLMDEDYLPNLLSGNRGRAGGRPKVGAGKGVNSKKRNK